MLAEAVRSLEQDWSVVVDDDAANDAARAAGGDMQRRIVTRARQLPVAAQLRAALHRLHSIIGWVIALCVLLAILAGAATARATLGVDGSGVANFYWVLGGILGVQTIALLLWLAAMAATLWLGRRADAASRPATAISLGSIVLGTAQWLTKKLHHDPPHAAAAQATARVHASGSLGRWTFSCITHGLWLAFNVGCLVMVIALLSARQYTFVWETTILTERHYVQLTRIVAYIPEAAGFNAPDEQQIAASQRREGRPLPTQAREAWSSLLVGSIVVYGFGPRLLLLGLSLGLRRGAKKRYRLDETQPHYARLQSRLADRPPRIKEHDEEQPMVASPTAPAGKRTRPAGPPAIVAVELNEPQTTWPPPVSGIQWNDLGLLENRDDQRQVTELLNDSTTEPARLVIACDLTTTPDRGIARLVNQLAQPLTKPPLMLLTGGHALRSRGLNAEHVQQRVNDWRQLASNAGIQAQDVVEIDLNNLTDHNLRRLTELVGVDGTASGEPSSRRIETAFERIAAHVDKWSRRDLAPSDAAAHAELHRAIAQVYRSDVQNWRQMLRAPTSLDPKDIASSVKSSADRVVSLLPDRLRRSPKWLAAGALSGAMGCVAAATLLSPVAIAALPTWSLIGAAITAVVQPVGREQTPQEGPFDYAQPVRAAALFALLLELQGRDEAMITLVLDRALTDDDDAPITDATDAQRSLDQLRHRLDLALAEVGR